MKKVTIIIIVLLIAALALPAPVAADFIDTTGPTGSFYIYASFTAAGTDVASYGDKIYVNAGSQINVYTVSIADPSKVDQHPSNPDATGPVVARTFTYEPTLSFTIPYASTSQSELYVDETGIYQAVSYGVVKYNVSGGVGTPVTIINSSTVANGHGISFLARDIRSGKFYAANEWNTDGTVNVVGKRRPVYGWNGSAWVEEFTYLGFPLAAGMCHFDGLEFVVSPDGTTGYMYVSDMTADYIGQWRLNGDGSWTETNLFVYADPGTNMVEGMGFGALGHFWASASTGSSGAVYEIGGGDLGGDVPSVRNLALSPEEATNDVGQLHQVTATALLNQQPVEGVEVTFTVNGAHSTGGASTTNAAGQCTFSYPGSVAGDDTIVATATIDNQEVTSNEVTKTWEMTVVQQPEICPIEYRWGGPAPGYEWDPFPITFRSWTEVRLENKGSGDAYNVTATITCQPLNVTVVDGDVIVGDIPAGGSAWSADSFTLELDMTNPQDPNKGICWRIEYDDAAGVHHVVENVAKYCGETCSDICP